MRDCIHSGGTEINLKLTIPFFLSAAFMLMMIGCSGGSQIIETPTTEAKVVVTAIVEPTPTNEPPTPEPTRLPTHKPSPTEAPPTVTVTTKVTELPSPPTQVLLTSTPTQVPPTSSVTPTGESHSSDETVNVRTLFARSSQFPPLMPCLQKALRQALGEIYSRNPSDEELQAILICVRDHAPELITQAVDGEATPIVIDPAYEDTSTTQEGTGQIIDYEDTKNVSASTDVFGQLISVRFPQVTSTTIDADDCQLFEEGICSELRWQQLTGLLSGEVTRIRIAPSNPDIIYAVFDANDMSAWKSNDAGGTWQRVHHFAHASDLVVHPSNPDIVLYSTLENNVYGTKDGGVTWNSALTAAKGFERGSTQFNALSLSLSHPGIVYAAIGNASNDRRIAGGTSMIYRSSDLAEYWQDVWEGSDLGAVYSLAVAANDPDEVYAGSNTGIFRSTNGGETWSSVWSNQQMRGGKIYSISTAPVDSALFLAAHTEIGILRSDDGGLTWSQSNNGIEDTRIHEVIISPSNNQINYAATHSGVFRSDDAGLTWHPRNEGIDFLNVATLDVHPTNPDVLYAGTGVQNTTNHHEHFVSGFQSSDGIYVTNDGGLSWTRTDNGIEEHGIVTLMADPNQPFRFWLGGRAGRGAFMTPDGGDTFLYNSSPASHYAMIIASGRRPPYPLYMTSWQRGYELTKSEDMGQTWKSLTAQLVNGVSRESLEAGLYRDSGVPILHLHALAVDPNDDDIVYVGSVHDNVNPVDFSLTGVHIFKSVDGGQNFTESSQGIPIESQTAIGFILVDPHDSKLVYAAFTSHESVRALGIYKSTDAGETWIPANEGLSDSTNTQSAQRQLATALQGTAGMNVRHLAMDPINSSIIYAATADGVFKSTDAAGKWSNVSAGITAADVYTLAISPRDPTVLYAATADGVFKSKNGGYSWYAVNLGLTLENQLLTMGHHVVLSFDATGSVLFAVMQAGESEFNSQRLVYRSVLDSLSEVEYTYALDMLEDIENVRIESTSSVYDLIFAQEQGRLDFTVAGPLGTTGQTEVFVSKSLMLPPFQVTLDEIPIEFDVDSYRGGDDRISFTYSHNLAQVSVTGRIPKLSVNEISLIVQECDLTPVIPTGGYEGLLTDVHVHTDPQFNQVEFARALLEEMNEHGVDRVVVQPNHRPQGDVDRVQGTDAIWGEIGLFCSRLIPMVYGFNPDLSNAWEYVEDKLREGGYGGVGEIEFQHGTFELSYDPESESLLKIYDLLETVGLAVHFQAMVNRNSALPEKLQKVVSAWPNLNFVWFGNSFAKEFMVLPNLYGETFLNKPILRSQDKLAKSLIASDSSPSGFDNPSVTYDNFGEAMTQIRQRLSEVPEDVANALAHGNFNKIWPKKIVSDAIY